MNETLKRITKDYKFIIVIIISLIGAPGVTYYLNKENRNFTYQLISFEKLISQPKPANMTILIDDRPIADPFYTLIKLQNTGNSPIKGNDFDGPISIRFQEEANIFYYSIVEKSPRHINTNISVHGRDINIEPTLFNPDDYIIIYTYF
jgi:hypothetical protein